MKVTCQVRVRFKHETFTGLGYSFVVRGKISSPGSFEKGQIIMFPSDSNPCRIHELSQNVLKGVWTPHIYLCDIDIDVYKGCWKHVQEDLANTFLPGYSFDWNQPQEMPIDWLPDKLKALV